ncbi:MAG: 50S ribosomal protein L25 [Candidatus Hydrogenedentes bacterium]|nr:50S ribosomal protein L25 [Candidatus Hydrogenedentota bacterium]
MKLVTIESTLRETGNKAKRVQTRATGNVPAVIYGNKEEPVSIAVNDKFIEKLLHTEGGAHAIVQLNFENTPDCNTPALIKAVQRHPIRDTLVHIDFLRIRLDQRIQSRVSVVLTGRAKGFLEGGVTDHQLREIEIECLAMEMPDHIEVDITELELGDSIHVSDLEVAEGITILTNAKFAVASIHAPRVLKTEEEEAAEAAEAAETAEGEEGGEGEENKEDGKEDKEGKK